METVAWTGGGPPWAPVDNPGTAHGHACNCRGVSLLEVIVAAAFVAVMSVQAASWVRTALQAIHSLENSAERDRSLWLALEAIAADVRNCGFSGAGAALSGIEAAQSDAIHLISDPNGDGDHDDANERIRYVFDPSAKALRRATGLSGAQVFVEGLDGLQLRLRYFDAFGTEIGTAASVLNATQRAAARRIDVTFESVNGAVVAGTSVHVRNAR